MEYDKLEEKMQKAVDYLCEECKIHFENVKKLLTGLGYNYTIDTGLEREVD